MLRELDGTALRYVVLAAEPLVARLVVVLREAAEAEDAEEEDLVCTLLEAAVPAGLLLVPATLVVAEEPAGRRLTEEPLLAGADLVDAVVSLRTPPVELTAARGACPI